MSLDSLGSIDVKPVDNIRHLILRKCPMEAFGTFAQCYFGGMAYAMYDNGQLGLNGVAISYGGIYTLMTYIGHEMSGAHFNPAVSFGYFLQGNIDFFVMMMYVVSQIVGGMIAASYMIMVLPDGYFYNMVKINHSVLGYPNTKENMGKSSPMVGELLATMTLMLVLLISNEKWQHKPERKGNYALCMGFVVMSSVYALAPISGAALNPARFLGPMFVSGSIQTTTTPYLAGPVGGVLLACLFYNTFLDFGKKFTENKEFGQVDGGDLESKNKIRKMMEEEYEKHFAKNDNKE